MDYDTENQWCRDCQRDKDNCPDCYMDEGDKPSLYLSPDAYEKFADR